MKRLGKAVVPQTARNEQDDALSHLIITCAAFAKHPTAVRLSDLLHWVDNARDKNLLPYLRDRHQKRRRP